MFSLYRFILSLHIIAVICWMAGILYLWRLFVYHAAEKEAVVKARFAVMEYRLYKYITTPSMIASFVFGFVMVAMNTTLFSMGWFHAKLLFVVALAGVTGMAGAHMKRLALGTNQKPEKFFRIMNEVPTVLMILIVFLVILRPF